MELDPKQLTTMNQTQNVMNPYQGDAKRVLCICSAGLLRSPTTAMVLNREYGHNTRACGTEVSYALIPITQGLVMWADEFVCMNNQQAAVIKSINETNPVKQDNIDDKIIVLNLPDEYGYGDEGLMRMIKNKYSEASDNE